MRRRSLRVVVDVAASVAMLLAAATLILTYFRDRPTARPGAEASLPKDPITLTAGAMRGSLSARIVMVEFSDFECPFCGKHARDVLPEIQKRYVDTGQLLYAFQHMPLEKIHRGAVRAAEGAECAGRGGKFWEMHDWLFAEKRQLSLPDMINHAPTIGISLRDFQTCMEGETTRAVRDSAERASSFGIRTTPSFLVGARLADGRIAVSRKITGAQPFDEFAKVIDLLVARK